MDLNLYNWGSDAFLLHRGGRGEGLHLLNHGEGLALCCEWPYVEIIRSLLAFQLACGKVDIQLAWLRDTALVARSAPCVEASGRTGP